MKIDRLMAITNILINRQNITAKVLAEEFEVSTRTIYRDIDILSASGIPIVTDKGKNGGISIIPGYKPDKSLFKKEEYFTLLSILEGINNYIPAREYKNITEKLKVFMTETDLQESKKNETVIFDYSPWEKDNKQEETLSKIKGAIDSQNIIKIVYTNNKAERKERRIEPMTLILKRYAWYMYGFCLEKNDFRIFKISRIAELDVENNKFTRKDTNVREVWAANTFTSENVINLKLLFKKKNEGIVRNYFSEEDVIERNEKNLIVNVRFPLNEWVYGFILSFGDAVEVLEPVEIREEIENRVKKMYKKYF